MIRSWKVSNINVDNNNGCFFLKGNLIAISEKNKEYIIPYGAVDKNKEVALKKAFSELCERASWFNMYDKYPTYFINSTGFSAHYLEDEGIINSQQEFYERQIFKILIRKMKCGNFDYIYKNFNILKNKDEVLFCTYISKIKTHLVFLAKNLNLLLENTYSSGITFGM